MNKQQRQELVSILSNVVASSEKEFVESKYAISQFPLSIKWTDVVKVLKEAGLGWSTMVVSGHGFLPEYQAQYEAEAKENIPLIDFGPGGFENYDVKGGVSYVLFKAS